MRNLGHFVGAGERRDAVHVAIVPALAATNLSAGQPVNVAGGEASAAGDIAASVGVVDPFLWRDASPGERVWIMLRPGYFALDFSATDE